MHIRFRQVGLWSIRVPVLFFLVVISVLVIALYGRRPLPPAVSFARVVPNLHNLPQTEVCWVETGHSFGSGPDSMTASALLVRHPDGDILIDGGNSSQFDREAAQYPFLTRLVMIAIPGRLRPQLPLPDALHAVGESPEQIRWLIPSHVHLDHIGGYEDLPRIPVLVTAADLEFSTDPQASRTGAVIPQQSVMLRDGRAQVLRFTDSGYELYKESFDLYGDGSIVLVPLPGHTPGSIGIFVNMSANRRIFYVGDTVLVDKEIRDRLRKPFFAHDTDSALEDEQIRKLNRLRETLPELMMIPAHGRANFFKLFPKGPGSCLTNSADGTENHRAAVAP